MGDVLVSLVAPLEARFDWRDGHEETEAKSDFVKAFSGFGDDFLARVAQEIRLTRTFRTMPTVGEVQKVAHKLLPPASTDPSFDRGASHPEWSHEAIRVADGLVMSDLGRQAARDGWILGLHDFCREQRRLPRGGEVSTIISHSRFIDRCAAGAEPLGHLKQELAVYASAFLDRREKLAKRVLGERE